MEKEIKINDKLQLALEEICDHLDSEETSTRQRQIRKWKKLKFYWEGFQRIWWSETAHDWRSFADVTNNDDDFYDKQINIFRAYLESIVAALSSTVPPVKCFPDDADNPLDLSTAKGGDKISELLYKHNDAILLWIHALFVHCTEGMVAAQNCVIEDEAFGVYNKPKYETATENVQVPTCSNCGAQLGPGDTSLQENEKYEADVDDDDAELQNILSDGMLPCATCMMDVDPELKEHPISVSRLVGTTPQAKSRIAISVHGGLFVKVANYAQNQSQTPYLRFSEEKHYSFVLEEFPDLKGDLAFTTGPSTTSTSGNNEYERWGRLSTQYLGEYPQNTPTVSKYWLRPCSFNIIRDEETQKALKKKFPNGARVVRVNDEFVEARNEALDDKWTLSYNPLADYIHHEPLGAFLVAIQDILNDMVSLTLQTIEHGIPQTFADPNVLDFNKYRQSEVSPGSIYPAKPKAGKSISDAFYEVKTASLSPEVQPFTEKINELGQLVSGALPSLFGGAADNSSKTASQYAMSRAQSLQRLQTPWKMLTIWWKTIFGKAIPSYIKLIVDDEKLVQQDENGNFINVFIRKAEMQGKIGSVELESSDQIPITWAQQKDTIMQLLQSANPEVLAALMAPENIPLLASAIGMDDFFIPGEADRQKQLEEIKILIQSQPIPDPMSHQGGMAPSVDIEPLVDNHEIEADICRAWLVGDAGRQCKVENPNGYQNVLLHMQRHMNMASIMQGPPPENAQGGDKTPDGQKGTSNKQVGNINGSAGSQVK